MHYSLFVLIPTGGDPADHVARVMEPHRESWNDDTKESSGIWDWYQIGGRWTGYFTGYDPDKDPENVEECFLCRGTGTRTDGMNGPGGCNGCSGEGRRVKWPTQWADHRGDVQPVSVVLGQDKRAYGIVHEGGRLMSEEWDGEDFIKEPEYVAKATAILEGHDGMVAIVDIHS